MNASDVEDVGEWFTTVTILVAVAVVGGEEVSPSDSRGQAFTGEQIARISDSPTDKRHSLW